jgi:hypothetical protein
MSSTARQILAPSFCGWLKASVLLLSLAGGGSAHLHVLGWHAIKDSIWQSSATRMRMLERPTRSAEKGAINQRVSPRPQATVTSNKHQ